ncbi:hypothetical protein Bbelb_329800 [Branchiostoma belcheri]|nr:hypothetical protein Bbelb_329800 [Branchiostoma belcheri]
MSIGTEAISGREKTDPPASLAKTRPDTPTTATTATTRKAISGRKKGRSRPLASPRQDLIPQLQQLQELQKLRVVRSLSYNIPFLNAVDCRCLSSRKRSLAVKKTVPPASLAKTGPDTPTTATTATTRKAISGREKRRSRPLASPRQDLIPQLQQLQELQKLRVVRSLSYNIPFLNEVDSGAYRHRSDVKPLKKTVPPASLAKTRPDTPTTATTAATHKAISGRDKRRSRPLASPKQDLILELQELQQLRVLRSLSYNIPFLKAVDSRRWTLGAYRTEAISGREKRRSRPLASPRQDLILQLQQLQELQQLRVVRKAVDYRCLSAQKRSKAVKKTVSPASLAKTRPDIPTTATTGTTATTRGGGLRCLSAQKRSEASDVTCKTIHSIRSRHTCTGQENRTRSGCELTRPRKFGYVSWRFRDFSDACSCDSSHSMPLVRTGRTGTHSYALGALVRTGRARTHWVHSYALGALIPGRHGEYVRIVSANNPARLDARRAIFVMSYMEHVPYACAASLGKQAVRVPEIRDAQPVAEKYTARSAALLSGCVHAGAAHPGHIRRGFRDGLHERSAQGLQPTLVGWCSGEGSECVTGASANFGRLVFGGRF